MPTRNDLRNASAALARFLDADRRADAAGATLLSLTDADPTWPDAWDQHGLALSERADAQADLTATAAALGASTDRPFALARSGLLVVHGQCFECQAETWTILDLTHVIDLSGVRKNPPMPIQTRAQADDRFRAAPRRG